MVPLLVNKGHLWFFWVNCVFFLNLQVTSTLYVHSRGLEANFPLQSKNAAYPDCHFRVFEEASRASSKDEVGRGKLKPGAICASGI